MSVSVQNLEEAATIASEFISSLDNLPSEVRHLLDEMRHKETRTQELYQEITKDSQKYIRHSLRHSAATPQTPASPAAPPPPATPAKYANAPPKIAAAYAEIATLADAKIRLAQRIATLVARTQARLAADLVRVGALQGEPEKAAAAARAPLAVADALGLVGGRSPAMQVGDSLRHALSDSLPMSAAVAAGQPPTKKRRVTATSPSIKLPSPSPVSAVVSVSVTAAYPRSRLSRQVHPPRPADDDLDADAEGDDDAEGEGEEGEDSTLYCFCQKKSYGDMIGCDNQSCRYQWFHVACVGAKMPLPENWYCSECRKNGAVPTRKGRKK